MSGTAATKARAKRGSCGKAHGEGAAEDGRPKRRRKKRATSEKQKAANQRNSERSTGPRTPQGKANSKYNAYKHGMTARSVLLPGEKAEDLAAHQQHFIDSFQPRHAVELAIVERMAADIWRADRVERSAGLRIAERLRHEPLEKAEKEQAEAIELGGRLFWQPAFPLPISRRSAVGKITEPQCAESPVHPHHPARLRLRLEQTLYGCDWLIARWHELSQRLYFNKLWLTADNFFMVRLLGKHAIDMADNLDVVRVFLCGLTLLSAPKSGHEREAFDWKEALIKMLVTFDLENKRGIAHSAAKQCEPFARRLAELPLAKLAPRDENHARSWLTGIIDQELRRLHDIRLYLQVVAQADEAEAPARLAFETGPEGDRQRRYGLSAERLMIKRFGDFLKTRAQIIAGTFDPTEVELQDLLGTASPSVVSGPSSAVIPHAAQTETLQREEIPTRSVSEDIGCASPSVVSGPSSVVMPLAGQTETLERGEILTRSVSEELGCGPSLTLRVSAGADLGEYGDALSFAIGQGDAVEESHSPCDLPTASVDGDYPVLSDEMTNCCDGDQFLRNEAISPVASGSNSSVVSGPLPVVGCEAGVPEEPGVPDQVITATVDRRVSVPSSEFADGCDDAPFLRNEAISPFVSGPLPVVRGQPLASEEPGVSDQQAPTSPKRERGSLLTAGSVDGHTNPKRERGSLLTAGSVDAHSNPKRQRGCLLTAGSVDAHSNPKRQRGSLSTPGSVEAHTDPKRQQRLPQLTRLIGTASSLTVGVRMPETSNGQSSARLLQDGISSVIDGTLADAIKRAITEGAKEEVRAGIDWSGFLRQFQAGNDRDFGVDRTPPGAAREV